MIITLCGSVRFAAEFIKAQRELSLGGILCFGLAVLPEHRLPDETWEDGSHAKTMGDLLYYKRIMHSDAILVLGDGYIGQSTAKEIIWASLLDKPVYRHYPEERWEDTVALIRSRDWSAEGEAAVAQARKFLGWEAK